MCVREEYDREVCVREVCVREEYDRDALRTACELSLLAVSPVAVCRQAIVLTYVKKDAMQPICTKSREKGSRNLTCPKVDMPKSR